MIIHIFPKSQFTEEFICFINEQFDSNEHEFILYTNIPFELPKELYSCSNVYDYDKKDILWLRDRLKKADRIILHNLGILLKELVLFFSYPSICEKTLWLIWGGDLYCYRNPRKALSDRAVETMRAAVIRRFPAVASLTDGDYELLTKWYGYSGKNIRLDYYEGRTLNLMNDIMNKGREEDGIIRILLGNSATQTNRHIEALEALEHLKDENILIYAPLSYGDIKYGEIVARKGSDLFGDKFIPLTDYMSREDYYHILYKIDVGVFNNDRQQGTGNIEALLYFGKKIFIRDDTTMWTEWVDKVGYHLGNIKTIRDLSAKDLVYESIEFKNNNRILIDKYFDVSERKKEWDKAFTMALE